MVGTGVQHSISESAATYSCRKLTFGVLHSLAALVLATPVAITIHVIWTYKNSRSEAGCWIALYSDVQKIVLVSCALPLPGLYADRFSNLSQNLEDFT